MNIIIREENKNDYNNIETIVERAFKNAEHSDQTEHKLVNRLRNSEEYIPNLSMVAEENGKIIGHIMFTKIMIKNESKEEESLALAPLSVIPEYQNRGIGSKLINESFKRAKELGYKSVVVLGHEDYYPRFGFKPAKNYGIKAPFEVPDNAFMATELVEGGLDKVEGIVNYSKAFFE